MKFHIVLLGFLITSLTTPASAEEKSCMSELGRKKSAILVNWCINVSPATHPPCNAANSCALITDEIKRGCAFLKNDHSAPYYCKLTYQNDPQ